MQIYVRMLYLDFRNVYCSVRCANTVTVHIKSLKFLFVKKEFQKKKNLEIKWTLIRFCCIAWKCHQLFPKTCDLQQVRFVFTNSSCFPRSSLPTSCLTHLKMLEEEESAYVNYNHVWVSFILFTRFEKKKRIHNCPVPDVGLRRVKTKIRTTWATNARISKIPEGSPEGIHELSNTQRNLTIHKQSLRGEESKQLSKVNATMKKTECIFFNICLVEFAPFGTYLHLHVCCALIHAMLTFHWFRPNQGYEWK